MDDPSVSVSLINSVGFSATMAGLVDGDINMAKCQQGNGFVSGQLLSIFGSPPLQHSGPQRAQTVLTACSLQLQMQGPDQSLCLSAVSLYSYFA